MSLPTGTRLGPYEILAPLGAGGMGEVYRARDPRMGREVAIKVCSERFSERFEREVRAVAALNHPNICHIYDVGPNYLVMELVEGPTLAERIAPGAIPLEESLPIARQIAEAVEAAHEKGIIHRDLKPANIKITQEGTVKVLDFGLAKALETPLTPGPSSEGRGWPEGPGEGPNSPTLIAATQAGVILGTAAYMSPEQAKGKTVDRRCDIWAFGCVLYEMLTGQRAFKGETVTETLAAVLRAEPDWNALPASTPPAIQKLLRRCLEKDSRRRLQAIGEARFTIDETLSGATDAGAIHEPPLQKDWVRALPWALAAILALVVALWAPWRGAQPPAEYPAVRLDLDLGPDVSLGSTTGPAVILSPDGTRLVFVSQRQDGTRGLFTRRLDQPKSTPLAKTEGAYAPFFSPDGQWVGFFAGGKLKKTRIDGGEPVSLCDAPAGRGASWGEDGNIIAALDGLAGLSQVPSEGGKTVSVTNLGPEENTHRWPQVLPGGRAVLFNASSAYANYDEAAIAVVTLKDHRKKILIDHAGMCPRYLPSGHLVYTTNGTLFAVPFDPDRLEVRGAASLIGEVSSNPNLGSVQLDVSRSGTLVYRSGGSEGLRTIQWLDRAGRTVPLWSEPAYYVFLRLSPDGSRLAYMMNQGVYTDLWIYDWLRDSKTRLTKGLQDAGFPVWGPDGQFVVFHSAGGMSWTRSDGAGKPQPLTHSTNMQLPTSFTPDGRRLVFSELTPGAVAEIRTVSVESGSGQLRAGDPQLFLKTSTANAFAAFSPDGRWLAYADAEAGNYDVYVRAFPDNGNQKQISNTGGMWPAWSRNGRELFYRTEDQRIMVVNYTVKGDSFVPEKPRVWFGKELANLGLGLNFDLAPDGKRFVVLMPAESPEPRETQSHVTLVVNFFDEVRRRVASQGK